VFQIDEQKHARFVRSGDNLIHKRSISMTEALCGTSFDLQLLDGKTIRVDCTDEVIGAPSYQKVIGM
jgi:DnaJ-class molecular chaperone